MEQNSRSDGRRSEVELSTLPEVAALATELTLMFKSLGVTQQQYAIRTNWDKSYVSRFLNGRRVATQEFIDRLLREVEICRHTPVTDQTRNRLGELRRKALRAYDPELCRLEILRDEVHKSQREVNRLLMHQEALEGLLERRQSEADSLRKELSQSQADWVADRVQGEARILQLAGEAARLKDERAELLQEITRLREELKATVEQKEVAEQRCALLEEQVMSVEIEMAQQRDSDGVDEIGVPVEYIQAKLANADESDVYRELSEFAISRSSADVARLCLWLALNLASEYASQLVVDYCRQRAITHSVRLVLCIEGLGYPDGWDAQVDAVSNSLVRVVARRSLSEFLEFCTLLAEARRYDAPSWEVVSLDAAAYSWLSHDRRRPGRAENLLQVLDHLDELGEMEAWQNVIKRFAIVGVTSQYARAIAESGREDCIRIFVQRWLRGVKSNSSPYRTARGLATACRFSNRSMADMMIRGVCDINSAEDVARMFLSAFDQDKPKKELGRRLAIEIVRGGLARPVRDFIAPEPALAFHEEGWRNVEITPLMRQALDLLDESERRATKQS
ncbi:helix-turn-helix domain-containing protein [Streptomyces sp. NPDC007157]|uniref:helix-turn-helix domain-containing protein n=1 Tax=Streptomyces sp. NPDC007157 TaxID=3154681 RepID=UPI00340CC1B9